MGGIQQKNLSKSSISSVQFLLSLSAVALVITSLTTPYFNSSIGLLLFSVDDVIGSAIGLLKAVQSKNGLKSEEKKQIAESIAHLISSLLYIAFIASGHIEILATCMLLQIVFNYTRQTRNLKKDTILKALVI